MDISLNDEITQQELEVASRIQQERILRRMSQMDLALEAGISQGYLAMIESHQKIPTITTIFKIAKALNIAPASLFQMPDVDKQQIKAQIIDLIQSKL